MSCFLFGRGEVVMIRGGGRRKIEFEKLRLRRALGVLCMFLILINM